MGRNIVRNRTIVAFRKKHAALGVSPAGMKNNHGIGFLIYVAGETTTLQEPMEILRSWILKFQRLWAILSV
jgi:hypothetical protein